MSYDIEKLRVWWIPQIPMNPFYVDVKTLVEAKKILDTLAAYDCFQLENSIKPDYCNAGGLQMLVDGEWEEWENYDTGENIDDLDYDDIVILDGENSNV